MGSLRLALFGAASLVTSAGAGAFTFTDGTTMPCMAHGRLVEEYAAPPGHPLLARNDTGIVEPTGTGYRIAWNAAKLNGLPPYVHDFIFFHECAHASVPTRDELLANCTGLKAMRAAGRAGFAVETRLRAFYGPGSSYWQKTVECADTVQSLPAPR